MQPTFYTTKKRFKKIFDKALQIDQAILSSDTRARIPDDFIHATIKSIFPQAQYLGAGLQKIVYIVRSSKSRVVLKVIRHKERMQLYIDPYIVSGKTQKQRNTNFIKHYWSTQFCILQKYAEQIGQQHTSQIGDKRKKYRGKLCDLKKFNFGQVKNRVKILDASVVRKYRSMAIGE
jgi:hypothetical protein